MVHLQTFARHVPTRLRHVRTIASSVTRGVGRTRGKLLNETTSGNNTTRDAVEATFDNANVSGRRLLDHLDTGSRSDADPRIDDDDASPSKPRPIRKGRGHALSDENPKAKSGSLRALSISSPRIAPRLAITEASVKHHNLESFLDYARRTELNLSSTVYKGTHYEYTVAKTLEAYHFSVQRVGRSNDLGIDLIGHWRLPEDSHDMRVLLQCKASQPKPSMVRELEGAYTGAPSGWNNNGAMAFLVTTKPVTQGVTLALQRSRFAMGMLQITTDGILQQFIWNQVAQETRLSGLSVANTYRANGQPSEPASSGVIGRVQTSVSLMWKGSRWQKSPS